MVITPCYSDIYKIVDIELLNDDVISCLFYKGSIRGYNIVTSVYNYRV